VKHAASHAPIDEPAATAARATFAQWVRHHVAAIIATAADYIAMVACVEFGGLRPVAATVAGALVGALVNLQLGRRFTYHVAPGSVGSYVWRYALVSGASLGWNAGGEALFHGVLGLHYVLARVITSVIVSNAWNYPMQRFFVFARHRSSSQSPSTVRRS
jgi:putative flippase GtrA